MGKREQKRLRTGVIGAGHMGQYHILVYAELWDVDLVGIVDADAGKAARLAAQYDSQALTDHRELFGKVDVVSISVPTPLHFQIAKDCIEAGISVLVEKPLTSTLEEARELFRIARERNVVLHVGHVERFNGAVQELRKIVANPILVESRRLGPFVPRVQHDTVVMDLMIHDVDIVLGLVDSEVRRITAAGARVHSARSDVANVQILFESGTVANITASRATEHKVRTLAITQPDAYIFSRLHGPGHPDPPARRVRVRAEPGVDPLPAGVLRRAPVRPQGESAQAGDPAHPQGRSRGAADGGRGAPGAGRRPLARGGARDRAHDRGGSAAPRLAAPLSGMAEALGLVGGAGALPVLMAREARRAGWRVVAFALADAEPLVPHADRVVPVQLGDVGPILTVLGEEGIRHVVLSGRVRKDVLFQGAPLDSAARQLRVEGRGLDGRGSARRGGARARGDGHRGPRPATVPGALAGGGRADSRPAGPSGARGRRARGGFELARDLAERGIGQTVVLRSGSVAAVEAMEGTDETVRRGLALAGRGAVVVKATAPAHDYRLDVPTVGPDTVDCCTAGGAAVLALQAGRVLLLERERVAAEAARTGMSVVGVPERPGVD